MKKISRLLMLIALLVNQFGWPMLAWAQEATLTETPTPTETPVVTETPVPTPEPTITETPIPTETPIITETPTPTETPIPTDTETPNPIETSTITPEPVNTEIPIPTETETPVPTETPLPGQTTSTETSTVSLPDKPTETPPPSLSETELLLAAANQNKSTTPTPEPVAKLLVEVSDNESGINNSAQICQDNQATADSGNNQISDNSHLGSSTIVSGEALALANIINVVNTNSVGSTIKLYLLDNVTGQVGEIDLNTAWNLLVSNGYNIEVAAVDAAKQDNEYSINNLGVIDNKLQVTANSGSNQIMADNNAGIYTGDAYALANIFNLLNINLQNSTLLVGIINVDGSSLENIILPNPESFSLAGERIETLSGEINNTAVIDSQVTNTANSGNNQINNNGDSSIQTGAALATTNVLTSANLNLSSTNQLMVALNILGEWTGQIYNFYGLGTAVNGGLNNLFLIGQQAKEEAQTDRLADINNTAMITNSVTVEATSGNNKITADGEATIKTGNAWSMANIFNMANLNLFNSNGFYMMINVLGNWKGNVIFAYPDLALSLGLSNDQLKIGEETNIKVNYANVGDDNTNSNNKIEIDLPENLEYVSDNSGLPLKRNNHKLMWQVDNMPAKAARNFIVRAKLISDNQTGWFLVQPAIAAEATAKSEVIINGQISTSRTETTTDNNNAQAVVYVNINGTETITNSGEGTTLWPKLVITEKNNVNNWVYKNDTVTFEINGKNEGEATAYNSYLLQSISDSKGNLLAKNRINIGDIVVGRPGKIVFGLPIKFNFYNDEKLTTKTELVGYTQKGEEVRSNVTQTSFILKSRMIKEVQAIDNNKIQTENAGQVLGTTNSETQTNKNLWVYLLLFSTSSVWMIRQTRKWLVKN